MGDPETKTKRSASRKRNYLAKKVLENKTFRKKVHESEKDREKQRKWRLESDPDSDYENVDDWMMRKDQSNG